MTAAPREDLLSTMLWGLLIPWGWQAARGCQHPSYSPLNHMQTTTLHPQGKPLPLPRKAMPSAIPTSAHPNPPQNPVKQPTRISAPLWSCPLSRLSPSLEAVSRTVWRTDMGHLVQCLGPKNRQAFPLQQLISLASIQTSSSPGLHSPPIPKVFINATISFAQPDDPGFGT